MSKFRGSDQGRAAVLCFVPVSVTGVGLQLLGVLHAAVVEIELRLALAEVLDAVPAVAVEEAVVIAPHVDALEVVAEVVRVEDAVRAEASRYLRGEDRHIHAASLGVGDEYDQRVGVAESREAVSSSPSSV